MKPTFGKRFWRPDIRAREVVVFPTCCLVAATKIGRGRFVENGRHDERKAVAALRGSRAVLFGIMVVYLLLMWMVYSVVYYL